MASETCGSNWSSEPQEKDSFPAALCKISITTSAKQGVEIHKWRSGENSVLTLLQGPSKEAWPVPVISQVMTEIAPRRTRAVGASPRQEAVQPGHAQLASRQLSSEITKPTGAPWLSAGICSKAKPCDAAGSTTDSSTLAKELSCN